MINSRYRTGNRPIASKRERFLRLSLITLTVHKLSTGRVVHLSGSEGRPFTIRTPSRRGDRDETASVRDTGTP